MKNFWLYVVLAALVCFPCFAQQNGFSIGEGNQTAFILPLEGKPGLYTQMDGTILSTDAALTQFAICPENRQLIEASKAEAVGSAIGIGAAILFAGAGSYLEITDLGDNPTRFTLFASAILDLFLADYLAKQSVTHRTNAMINYNFYIMGVPIVLK
jgi:hypothetical protein